jgi:RNA-directed DNA polymerase
MSISEIRDQIVQTALQLVLQPIFEPDFCGCSYGYRKRRGAREALIRVVELLESGFTGLVGADIEKFFDSIPQQRLLGLVERKSQG